jgi:hypothetical protein
MRGGGENERYLRVAVEWEKVEGKPSIHSEWSIEQEIIDTVAKITSICTGRRIVQHRSRR